MHERELPKLDIIKNLNNFHLDEPPKNLGRILFKKKSKPIVSTFLKIENLC